MRTIAISDIHGCFYELESLLNKLKTSGQYSPDKDRLIFLGDYIDRGPDSRSVVKLVRDLQRSNENVIALMGNHEDMLLEYTDGLGRSWAWNGHRSTLLSYEGHDDEFADDIKWMRNLPLYYEDEHFIFVHAGVDETKSMYDQDQNTLLWKRYSWEKYSKRVVFGHTPCFSLGIEPRPFEINGNIGIDSGCVYGGALTALIIDDDKVSGYMQNGSGMRTVGNMQIGRPQGQLQMEA